MKWNEIVDKYGYDTYIESDVQSDWPKEGPKHHLFHCCKGGYGTEYEVTNFLHALVLSFKFENILETGCEQAHGTSVLAAAVEYNGVGHVTTVDSCDLAHQAGPKRISDCGLSDHVTFIQSETVVFAKSYDGPPFDFAFFDCGHKARIECFHILNDKHKLSRIAMFHDASYFMEYIPIAKWYLNELNVIGEKYGGLQNILSRGFRLFQLDL